MNTLSIKPIPKLTAQPDGYSCGATAVKMALELFNKRLTVEELKPLFLTNPHTGTTHEGMIAGFEYLKVPYTRTVADPAPFTTLDEAMTANKVFLMRTLISGCKHWILIYAKRGSNYMVADPMGYFWELSPERAERIWGARDYDGFIIDLPTSEEVVIRPIREDEVDDALFAGYLSFKEQIPSQTFQSFKGTVMGSMDDDISKCFVAVHRGDVIGGYFLGARKLWIEEFENLNGLHGVALFLLPEYRGMGIGNALRSIPIGMEEVDYIWGMHMDCLKNVGHWTKFGRVEIEDFGGCHTTVMDLRKKRASLVV